MDDTRILALREAVEARRREAARAEAELETARAAGEAALADLKALGVGSVEEAQEALEALDREIVELTGQIEERLVASGG